MEIKRDDTPNIFVKDKDTIDVIDTFTPEQISPGIPKIAQIMKIEAATMVDPNIETMALAIDKYILDSIIDESMKESGKGYDESLKKVLQRLGVNVIEEVQRGNAMRLINRLFQEAAINNRLSTDSFMKKSKLTFKEAKIKELKTRLKELIKLK